MLHASPSVDPSTDPAEVRQEIVIQPRKGLRGLDLREIWQYRELLGFLVWRDVKVKYKMAMLGVAWAVLVPTIHAAIYSIFGLFMGMQDRVPDVPYPLWMLAGVVPWLFIQRSFNDGGLSLLNHQALLTKIYMPRLFIPAGSIGGALFDMGLMLGIFVLSAGIYAATSGYVPPIQILLVPVVLVLTVVAAFGTATLLSALIVLYRDLRFLIQFLSQFGLWLSGVAIPTSIFGKYEWVLAFNPYAGLISAWRWCLVGTDLNIPMLIGSCVGSPLLLLVGVLYFRRVERRFADIA